MEDKIIKLLKKTEEVIDKANIKPELSKAAFGNVFRILWSMDQVNTNIVETNKLVKVDTITTESDLLSPLEKISQVLSIDLEKIKDIFYLDETGKIQIIKRQIDGKTIAEKQAILTTLILFAHKTVGQDWVDTEFITNIIKDFGYHDGHLSRTIKRRKDLFGSKGKLKGVSYFLTSNGETYARKIISKILGVDTNG